MKIKTITCHDVYNHGASLQAFALQQYLKDTGNEVEIIDYKPVYDSSHFKLWVINNPYWNKNLLLKAVYLFLKFPERLLLLRRKRPFDDFKKKYLTLTNVRYNSIDELRNNPPQADVFLAGSDQIWNCLYPNGKDPAFYLDFVSDKYIKASYAASFAGNSLDSKYHSFVKKRVERLDFISVREESGLNILKDIGILYGVQSVDPVFLQNKSFWNDFGDEEFSEDYLFVYDLEGNKQIRDVCIDIARKRMLKIYTVNCRSNYVDKKFLHCGPKTFVSLIKNAQYIVSNSFHGTAFAIIFEKEFFVVNRSEGINARMKDLLNSLSLENRIVSDSINVSKIDYLKVHKQLDLYIEKSKDYLRQVVLSAIPKA